MEEERRIRICVRVADLPPIVHVACGYHHTIAASEGGRVFVWGSGSLGKYGLSSVLYIMRLGYVT